MKIKSPWTLLKVLVTSAVTLPCLIISLGGRITCSPTIRHGEVIANKNFSTKTRLCNTFKTTNSKMLIKGISGSLYMLLKTP